MAQTTLAVTVCEMVRQILTLKQDAEEEVYVCAFQSINQSKKNHLQK